MQPPVLPSDKSYRKYFQGLQPILRHPKTKSYSTIIFFFLVLSLFGWYAIKPTIQTILYLRREIRDKTEVSKKMDDKINALIQAEAIYEQIAPYTGLLTDAVPDAPSVLELVDTIQRVAYATNATVSAIQIGQTPILAISASDSASLLTKHTEFPLSLSVDGSYEALKSCLSELVSLRRIVQIKSMNFIQGERSTSTASARLQSKLRLVLQISSFWGAP